MSESILLIVILVFRQVPDGHSSSSASSRTPRNRASTSNQEEVHIGKYRLIKTIGKGNFAKVKLAKHVPTGKEVNKLCHSLFTVMNLSVDFR